MSANRSQQDKKIIAEGFKKAKEHTKNSEFDQAHNVLKQIQPIIVRTKFFEFEFSLLRALVFDKQEKPDECIKDARNAERLKPDDINVNRLLIHSYVLLDKKDELAKEISIFFTKHSKDEKQDQSILVDLISPHLKDLDDKHHEDITLPFIECLKKLPDYKTINVAANIPETEDTVQLRCELLRPHVKEDQDSCSQLIQLLLYEIPENERDVDELVKISQLLPPKNKDRLLIQTYFGPDPAASAKLYDEVTSSDKFKNFIDAYESNNLKELKNQLNYDSNFSSGWVYYGDQVISQNEKLNAYEKALKAYPNSIPILLKIMEVQADLNRIDNAITTIKAIQKIDPPYGMKILISFLIKNGKGDEAEKYIGSRESLSDIDKALISFLDYEKSHDKDKIRFILDLPHSPQLAEVRSRAIYELRDEVGSKAQSLFAECLKQLKEGTENGTISKVSEGNVYLYFAKWLDSQKQDDKAAFIFEKCIEKGVEDDQAYDKVTRKLIKEGKLDEALQMCLKINNEWSHFRAGLILQRQENHEKACGQFQAEIGLHPDNYTAWKALAQSYLVLGRAMATLSVVQFLKEKGQYDKDLEYQVLGIFERPINIKDDEDISKSLDSENTPIPLYTFLSQKVSQIINLASFGRIETCKLIIVHYEPVVDSFQEKWGNLGAVLRICGQFFLESFKITKEPQHMKKALMSMKKRAEIDVRPESFIDLSSVFIEMGQPKQAVAILHKVINKFPDNAQLWTNLAVSYALTKEMTPFSRHCLCVAAKIATDSEVCKVYSLYSSIASTLNDAELALRALEAAERAKPDDVDVQLLKLLMSNKQSKENDKKESKKQNEEEEEEEAFEEEKDKETYLKEQLDFALLAFEYGASQQIALAISQILLQLNRPFEALGFSLFSSNNEMIAASYEALGKYETALSFTENEETKERLIALLGRDQDKYEVANFLNHGDFKEALESLSNQADKQNEYNSFVAEITKAVCLANMNKKEEAVEKLIPLRKKIFEDVGDSNLLNSIDRLILLYSPQKMSIGNVGIHKSYKLRYLKYLRDFKGDEIKASSKLVESMQRNPNAIKIFLIQQLYKGYNTKKESIENVPIIQKAESLALMNPSRETYLLLLATQIREKLYISAYSTIQKLCIMDPNLINKSKDLIKMIAEKRQENTRVIDNDNDDDGDNNDNYNNKKNEDEDDDDFYYEEDDE